MSSNRTVIETALASTGLSQVALAQALGVDPSTLRRWLSGSRELPEPVRRSLRVMASDPSWADALASQA